MSISSDIERNLTLGGETVEVRTLAMGKYFDTIKRLQKLPAAIALVANAEAHAFLPSLLAAADETGDEMFDIVEVMTGKERQWLLENAAPHELIAYIEAWVEVNRIDDVIAAVKKYGALFGKIRKSRPAE
jgi:hypothetical protein